MKKIGPLRVERVRRQPPESALPTNATLADHLRAYAKYDIYPHDPEYPRLLTVTVDEEVTATVEIDESKLAGRPPTNVVLWPNTLPRVPSNVLGHYLYRNSTLRRNGFGYVWERNKRLVAIDSMLKLIHKANPSVDSNLISELEKIVIVLDPRHALPVLASMMWPNTTLVGVFSTQPRIDRRLLKEFDCVITCPSVRDSFTNIDGLPLLLTAGDLPQVAAAVKSVFQITASAPDGYHYSMRERKYPEIGRRPELQDADLIFVSEGIYVDDLVKPYSRLSDYTYNLVMSADDVLIHSRWLYRVETMLTRSAWPEMIQYLIQRGARVAAIDPKETVCE